MISKDIFWELLYSDKSFLTSLVKEMCSRIRESTELVERLTYNKAHQRVKLLFMKYALSQNKSNDNGTPILLKIPLTHQDIADMTGLTRETVSAALIDMKNNGEISSVKSKIYKLNPPFFENL
ncbi:MAG: Crp/Fnr family transcriptional regulator [Nitrospirae bacterium YQR-1]